MELNDNIDGIIDRHRRDSFWTGVLVGALGAFVVFAFVVVVR